jgi:hypothetical protein
MRQPAIDPVPALRSLIAALPDDRLRAFVLEELLATLTTATAPAARDDANGRKRPSALRKRRLDTPAPATSAGAGKRGWPRGRPRGPRKATLAAAAAEAKLAQRRREEARRSCRRSP